MTTKDLYQQAAQEAYRRDLIGPDELDRMMA